jgi:putative ABC transport system permease protein
MRHRAHTVVAVGTLAVAVGAATAVFGVLNAVLLRPLPYPDADRLVIIRDSSPRFPVFSVSPGRFLEWQRRGRLFDGIAATGGGNVSLTGGGGEPERVPVAYASANLFEVIGIAPIAGRAFTADEDRANGPRAAILSESLWRSRFGGRPDIVGTRIDINEIPTTVVGVMPASFEYPSAAIRVWVPLALTDQQRANYGSHYLRLVGRMSAGVSLDAARADLERAARDLAIDRPENDTWTSLVDSMHGLMVERVRGGVWLLAAAAAGVLLIACANVAGLLLARGADRQREFAVRSALGASRWRMARQLLVESLLLGVLGAVGGSILALALLRALVASPWFTVPRVTAPPFDLTTVGFAAAMALLTPVIFGLVPAWQIASPAKGLALAAGGRSGTSALRARTRSSLIVGEIALAVVLVAGSALLIRSLDRLLRVPPGFQPSGLYAVGLSLPAARYGTDAARTEFFRTLVERASAIPGAERVAVANPIPFVGEMMSGLHLDGIEDDPSVRPPSHFYAVTPGYFSTMGIPLLRGRDFTDADRADAPRVAIVSRQFAETLLGGLDVLGRRVRISQGPRRDFAEVVGVAEDVRHRDLDGAGTLQTYEPLAQHPYFSAAQLVVRTDIATASTLSAVRGTLASIDPLLPVAGVNALDDAVASTTGAHRFTTTILAALAGVALLLAAVGIYGLVSFSVGRRVQEFGLRVALGADPRSILRLVIGEGLKLSLAGVAIGLVCALLAGRAIGALLFEVSARDPIALAVAALVLVAATLIACYAPARRALGINPVAALRQS